MNAKPTVIALILFALNYLESVAGESNQFEIIKNDESSSLSSVPEYEDEKPQAQATARKSILKTSSASPLTPRKSVRLSFAQVEERPLSGFDYDDDYFLKAAMEREEKRKEEIQAARRSVIEAANRSLKESEIKEEEASEVESQVEEKAFKPDPSEEIERTEMRCNIKPLKEAPSMRTSSTASVSASEQSERSSRQSRQSCQSKQAEESRTEESSSTSLSRASIVPEPSSNSESSPVSPSTRSQSHVQQQPQAQSRQSSMPQSTQSRQSSLPRQQFDMPQEGIAESRQSSMRYLPPPPQVVERQQVQDTMSTFSRASQMPMRKSLSPSSMQTSASRATMSGGSRAPVSGSRSTLSPSSRSTMSPSSRATQMLSRSTIQPVRSHPVSQPASTASASTASSSNLNGIHLGFCDTAALSLIVNIRLLALKFPRQSTTSERAKMSQYISSLIANFPCDTERNLMLEAVKAMPPIYSDRRAFNRWADFFGKRIMKGINSPVGINLGNVLVPVDKKQRVGGNKKL